MDNVGNAIPQKVLIEFVFPGLNMSWDVECPSSMSIDKLRIGLLRQLKDAFPHIFSVVERLDLFYEMKKLPDSSSLADWGAWDGSIITVELH